MFGKYCHALTAQARDQCRTINGESGESDERIFNIIKRLVNNTSNHHAHNVISNAYVRYHVRNDFLDATRQNEIHKTEAEITDLLSNFCVQTLKSRDLLREVSNKRRFFICKV